MVKSYQTENKVEKSVESFDFYLCSILTVVVLLSVAECSAQSG